KLENQLSAPSERLIEDIKKIEGDIMILGVGGKMGPSMAKLAIRAFRACGSGQKVIGVSRFSDPDLREELEDFGVKTIAADLLKETELQALPEPPNVLRSEERRVGKGGAV